MSTAARFANAVGAFFVTLAPDRLTQEFAKVDRHGRIYVDTGRNGYHSTFAAAYTVRARPGAPVSAPCTWDEVENGAVQPRSFTLRNMADRVAQVGDLWAGLPQHGQSLAQPMEKLRAMQR
jgi:bifunctional non-homologous end joining protein LigD